MFSFSYGKTLKFLKPFKKFTMESRPLDIFASPQPPIERNDGGCMHIEYQEILILHCLLHTCFFDRCMGKIQRPQSETFFRMVYSFAING